MSDKPAWGRREMKKERFFISDIKGWVYTSSTRDFYFILLWRLRKLWLTNRKHWLILAIHSGAIAKIALLILFQLQKTTDSGITADDLVREGGCNIFFQELLNKSPPFVQCLCLWGCSVRVWARRASLLPALSDHSGSGYLQAPRLLNKSHLCS